MLELLRKTLLTGVGLVAITKDKIEELSKDLVKKGELTEQEGRQLADDLIKKSEQAKADLETRVNATVHSTLDKLNLATKEEVTRLKARIEELEQKLSGQHGSP